MTEDLLSGFDVGGVRAYCRLSRIPVPPESRGTEPVIFKARLSQ